jgi:hypothetical protein
MRKGIDQWVGYHTQSQSHEMEKWAAKAYEIIVFDEYNYLKLIPLEEVARQNQWDRERKEKSDHAERILARSRGR